MCFNDYPRACALGYEEVSPLQGSSQSIDVSKMILRCIIVGFFVRLFSPRWVHYRNGCVKIGMGIIVRLPWVRSRAPTSKFKRIMSAVGTILFHSPGCNEGKARNGTLGTHRQKRIELRRSGTNRASVWFVSLRSVALHSLEKCRSYGAQKCVETINPGLAPWAMKKCRPYRALFFLLM